MEATENKDVDTKAEDMEDVDGIKENAESEDAQNPEENLESSEETDTSSQTEETGSKEAETEDGSVEENAQDEKKGLFKKKNKKDKQEEKIAELNDRVQRQMAEFDNFRKRTEKEKAQMFEVGAKSIIEKILPVVDNFERGLSAVPDDAKDDPFVEGMDKIYKQLMTELENLEVKPIEAVGTEFNPEFHNAVMQVESDEFESGIVAQELQRGYMYRDSVVRHSMVAVVQ